MLSPDEIRRQCERKYPAFLRSVVAGESFFPLQIRFGRPSPTEDWSKLSAGIGALARGEKELGYRIEWVEVNARRWGQQQLPHRVWIDDEAAFLTMLRKTREVETFRGLIQHTREACPELEGWLQANTARMIEHAGVWADLLVVCRYFMAHPRPNRYARELPIPVDTKFIERHQGILRSLLDHLLPASARNDSPHFEKRFGLKFEEPRIHLRLLDRALKPRLGLCVDDVSIPLSQFVALEWSGLNLVIAENRKTFLTLPPLDDTVGVLGGGGAAELLASAGWCAACRLVYWGDLDVHGFHILARLRRTFPQLTSMLMDVETLDRFQPLCGPAKPAVYEDIATLTSAERAAYERVKAGNLLLEQEKIPHEHVVARLRSLIGAPIRAGDQ